MLPAADCPMSSMQPRNIRNWIGHHHMAEQPPWVTQFQFESLKVFLRGSLYHLIFSHSEVGLLKTSQDRDRRRVSISQENYDFQDMGCSLRWGGARVFPCIFLCIDAAAENQRYTCLKVWAFNPILCDHAGLQGIPRFPLTSPQPSADGDAQSQTPRVVTSLSFLQLE